MVAVFAALADRIDGICRKAKHGLVNPTDPATESTLWAPRDLEDLSAVVTDAIHAVSAAQDAASATRRRMIEEALHRHLGRSIGPVSITGAERGDLTVVEEMEVYDALADDLFNLLSLFAEDVTASPAPQAGSPDAERDYVAMRLGRTRAGLDGFVSTWKSQHGTDLPLVVRKPLLPWMVNKDAFEEWRLTSEGDKAQVRRRRGRPPKPRL